MRATLVLLLAILCTAEGMSQTFPPTAVPRTTADEVRELQASLNQIHERLQRLSVESNVAPTQFAANPIVPNTPTITLPSAVDTGLPNNSPELRAYWKNGLNLKSVDDIFTIHVGGSMQYDQGWNRADYAVQYGPDGIGNLQDGGVFRRARLRIDGTLYRNIDFVAEYDFANSVENDTNSGTQLVGSPSFSNAYVSFHLIPWLGTVRIGWMTEPLGMENYTSSRWLPFMERMPGNPLYNSPGVLLMNHTDDERATWAFGVYHAQDNNFGFGYGDGEYAYTTRMTCLPLYENDGEHLIHLGVSASHRHLESNEVTFRGRPSIRTMPSSNLPSLADTDTIDGTSLGIVDFEFASVWNSWTFQSEYFANWVNNTVYNGTPQGRLFYQGAYVEALYFLTGEHQAYNRTDGTFGRVEPLSPFNPWGGCRGTGAWQVGVRYAYLDLQNKAVDGATLNDITLGLNWFLNAETKIQWNLAIDHRDATPSGSNGWTYILGCRLALDF